MLGYILLTFFFVFFSFLLFAPLQLHVNSEKNHYSIHWGWIIHAQFIPDRINLIASRFQFKMLFWHKNYFPFFKKEKAKVLIEDELKKDKTKPGRKKSAFKLKHPVRKVISILQSFHIREFHLDIDTDDYVTNAYLYPIFRLLSLGKRRLNINYEGIVCMDVNISNSGWRLIYAFFK